MDPFAVGAIVGALGTIAASVIVAVLLDWVERH